jgi:hypothetical protein
MGLLFFVFEYGGLSRFVKMILILILWDCQSEIGYPSVFGQKAGHATISALQSKFKALFKQ